MDSNMVTNQLNGFRQHTQNANTTNSKNSTIIPKIITTAVHDNLPEMKQSAADLVCYGLKTDKGLIIWLIKTEKHQELVLKLRIHKEQISES